MKKTINNNQKGITLIALVITIIVLLILAGVAISMLSGENGILRQAANAKTETEKQSTLEQIRLAAISAMTNPEHKVTAGDLNKELGKYGYSLENPSATDNWTVTKDEITYTITSNGEVDEMAVVNVAPTTAVAIKTKYIDESCEKSENNAVIIPEGFYVKKESDKVLGEIDKGVVVVAPDGSEFVWVPVDRIDDMYGTLEGGTKAGKLYNNGDITSKLNWTETDGVMSWTSDNGNREPAVLNYKDEYREVNDSANGVTLSTLQKEFEEMIKYVEVNGGFYVGRYETSLDESGNVQSKENVTSATAEDSETNMWYGLYAKQKTYKNSNVGSSMIWGCQYDQMMIWMNKNEYDVTSATPKTGVSYNNSDTTGKEGNPDVMNNVNDLIGCHWEWTIEANATDYRVSRSGVWWESDLNSPGARGSTSPYTTQDWDFSSRLALYVK